MNLSLSAKHKQPKNQRHFRVNPVNIGLYILTLLLCITMLFPLFWVITTALKGNNDIYKVPPEFFPKEFKWENFPNSWEAINFSRLLFNTSVITVLNVIGQVASSMLVGYALARIRFPGRQIWFYLFIGSMMLPSIVTLIPLFRLYLNLNWYDSWLPLWVPALLGNPFYIFLARQYYFSIPYDLDESAKIDGANHFAIFTRIMIPLTTPVWITMAILTFQATWNDYLNPLIYLQSEDKWTLALGVATFKTSFAGVSNSQWNLYMAANLLYMLPPIIVFFVAQRYFMAGLGSLATRTQK